jgi:hypothetical protein
VGVAAAQYPILDMIATKVIQKYQQSTCEEEKAMITRFCLVVLVATLLFVGVAAAQYPILDLIITKVIQKYQQETCEQMWQDKGKPKPPMEQELIQNLRSDPQMRTYFLNKVAGPIANKMFECGLIP